MSRSIGILGFPENEDAEFDIIERVAGQILRAAKITRRVRPSQRHGWVTIAPPPTEGEEPTDPGDDNEAIVPPDRVVAEDPGNPADWNPSDFIGPSGAKVPDLSTIYVTVSRRGGPAPCAVTFQLRSTDPNFPSFVAFGVADWSFSADPLENYVFEKLDGLLAGERAGTAKGPYVVHTYEQPGTHSWSVTLRYPGLAPRVINNTAFLLSRADLATNNFRNQTDVPAWLGVTKGVRGYVMPSVITGGRINVRMSNGHGTKFLRNIEIPDGATGEMVAAAIVNSAARDVPATQILNSAAAGISFTSTGSTLNITSSCPLSETTISIEPGDVPGVTWDNGTGPNFSTPAPSGASQTLYSIPGVITGGAMRLALSNDAGVVDCGTIYFANGEKPWDVCNLIVQQMERSASALSRIGVGTGQRALRINYTVTNGTRLWVNTARAASATTISLTPVATPSNVIWDGAAPNMSATVPVSANSSVGNIVVFNPEVYFNGRTVYCSPAYNTVAEFKAAIVADPAAHDNIPSNLSDSLYYVGPEAYFEASQARDNAVGNPWRILLHAGQDYVFPDGNRRPGTINLYVSRFGVGYNPKITITETFNQSALLNYQDSNQRGWATFFNIDFIGLYDSANPPFSAGWLSNLFQLNSQNNYGFTMHRCVMSGWRTNISVTGSGALAIAITDTLITSWYDFGMYANATHASGYAGVAIKQKLGTVNLGRRSSGLANVGDRYRFNPASQFTSLFSWALEAPTGPIPKSAVTVVPIGYEAPATGEWGEHPYDVVNGGTAAWDWWVANWEKFTWKSTNSNAFKNKDNDLYRDCAVHGPVRGSTPSYQTGWHQCEFRSLNGWSRSGVYDKTKTDLEQTDPRAFAIQPCMRMATAMSSQGPSIGNSTCMWRCTFEGGGTAVVAVPEQNFQQTIDSYSLGPGMLLDGMIYRALLGARTAFGAQYGRVTLRNSFALFDDIVEEQQNLLLFGGTENDEPPGSAYNYVYNNTIVFARNLLASNPNSKFGFAKISNRQLNKRMSVVWNNLGLQYEPVRNGGDFPIKPSGYQPLTDPFGFGFNYAPLNGSAALGAAANIVPYYDFENNIRPASAAIGCLESQS